MISLNLSLCSPSPQRGDMSTKCTTNLNSFIDKAVKEDYQDAFFWWKMIPTLASSLQFAQTTDGRGIRGQKRCMYSK